MHSMTKIGTTFAVLVGLAACGGSGDKVITPEPKVDVPVVPATTPEPDPVVPTNPDPVDPTDPDPVDPTSPDPVGPTSFEILEENFANLEADVPGSGSLPAAVPTTGSAVFTGLFSGELDPDVNTSAADVDNGDVDFIAGDAQIIVDFQDETKTIGAIGNLRSDTVDSISGQIALFDFDVTRASNGVVFGGVGADGRITQGGFYSGTLEIADPDYASGEQKVFGQLLGGYFGSDGEYINVFLEPLDDASDVFFDGDVVLEREPE